MTGLPTPFNYCPVCEEIERFGFIEQSCPCGWSLDDDYGRRDARLLSLAARVVDWLSVAVLLAAGLAMGADATGAMEVPALVMSALLGGVVVLELLTVLIRRSLRTMIGGGRRVE